MFVNLYAYKITHGLYMCKMLPDTFNILYINHMQMMYHINTNCQNLICYRYALDVFIGSIINVNIVYA